MAKVYGGLEWNFLDASTRLETVPLESNASGSWGCRVALGCLVVSVEVGGPGNGMANCQKGATPNPFFSGAMGKWWSGKWVEYFCNNMAVVAVVNSRTRP